MRSKFKWIFTLLLAFSMQFSFAQEKTITGTITDQGLPLPGVNVVVKGTARGTQTDFDGKYSIKASQGEVLEYSFIGYKTSTVAVGASSSVNVVMEEDATLLNEVVITDLGYFKRDANKITSGLSVVSGDELTRQAPSTSVDNALQGKAAGVQVSSLNGQPGQRAYVSVRGATSITGGNANAVYVVDGAFVSASETTGLSSADVESVTVLKDGAAAALYGIRGANGVIVITTKKGKAGSKTKFEISNSFGFSKKIKDPYRMMNAEEKIRYENELGEGLSVGLSQSETDLLKSYNHDWDDDLLQDGYMQNFNFSMSGGTEKMTNFLSLGYNKNTGIIKNLDGYDRITTRYNTDFQASDYIKVGMAIGGAYEKNTLPRDRNNVQNPFRARYSYNAYEPLYERDPSTGEVLLDQNGNPSFNPTHEGLSISEAILNNTTDERYFRGYVRPYVELKLYKGLVFTTKFNMNYERRQSETYTKPGSQLDLILNAGTATGQKGDSGWDNFDYQWTNTLNYSFSLGEAHNFSATLLYEYFKNNFRSYGATRKGFANPDISVGPGTTPVSATSARTEYATISYFGNVDYDYKGRYLLSLYGRRDGSSLMGENDHWEFAKGASVGWNITKEDFFSVDAINLLKIRGSYGELNATNGVGNYSAQSTYANVGYAGANGTVYTGDAVGNLDLKFEKAKKLDIGIDSQLFNNRIAFTAGYFNDKRDSFIYGGNTPLAGWSTLTNVGEWTAKGFELEFKGFAIKNENMSLAFYVNGAIIDRKINTLSNPNNPDDQILRGFTVNRVGYSPDTFYMVRYAGVDASNGHALYYDKDGAITDVYSSDDEVLIKDKTPYAKYEGGFGMEFSYKGFDVNADFVFKSGNYSYNLRDYNNFSDGNQINSNQAAGAFDYWTPTNTNASLPAPYQLNFDEDGNSIDTNQVSTRFLQDASYIRFRSLNFGYTFDKKILKDLPLDKVRVYCQMQNLYTWTDFNGDPEIGIGNNENADGASTTNSLVVGQFYGYT
ncbi:SusC/RagA family TonB-linked outer membrane protein, partial [uncultured Flavobacterium sp.]|uniref:SusC/RagA family TonB-linked outer membrane protein n=1 Tax=uncultured Flavobacterium sp. TaxID=165435 RepID=UPI0025F9D5F2